jgi:hypothetical protein
MLDDNINAEGSITIRNEAYKLKATFLALSNIEKGIGKSIIATMQDMMTGDISLTNVTIMFTFLNRAAGGKMTIEAAGALLLSGGYVKQAAAILEVIKNAITAGSSENEGEENPS